MAGLTTTAAERWITGLMLADPVISEIFGTNVFAHEIPQDLDDPYPCVLFTLAHPGEDAMEEGLSRLVTDPEYFVRGVQRGLDMIGTVREGEDLGDLERGAARIDQLLHGANGVNVAGVIAGAWRRAPFAYTGHNTAGESFSHLGGQYVVLVSDPEAA